MPCGLRTVSESSLCLPLSSLLPSLPPSPLSFFSLVLSAVYLLFVYLLSSFLGILVSTIAHGPTKQLSQSHIPIWLHVNQHLNDKQSVSQ